MAYSLTDADTRFAVPAPGHGGPIELVPYAEDFKPPAIVDNVVFGVAQCWFADRCRVIEAMHTQKHLVQTAIDELTQYQKSVISDVFYTHVGQWENYSHWIDARDHFTYRNAKYWFDETEMGAIMAAYLV